MQKKIIALAVAGLVSGAAFAQSNVTVYGFADIAYEYNKSNDLKFSGLSDGGWSQSRIGFKGEEALGNGLKAVFQMEYATSVDSYDAKTVDKNNNTAYNSALSNIRQSWLGLSGNFGTVSAGRQYAPSFELMGKFSANEVTNVNPMNLFYNEFSTMGTGAGSRFNNSIKYVSPNFSGLTARAIYAFGEKVGADAETTDAQKFGAAVDYANGPFSAAVIYQRVGEDKSNTTYKAGTTPSAAATINNTLKNAAWYAGAGYDFGAVKLVASYQKETNDQTNQDPTLWSVGAIVPVSAAGKVRFEYAALDADKVGGEDKSKGFGLGYTHDLSKRTVVYTYVSRITNQDNMKYGRNSTGENGENNTNFIVGVRHAF